ncbi:MAG: Alanine racemase, catabolic [Betaproteobacteria bacterium]|nr:Alanine racemase, catabolic [Betaproteobacteria bacterium]MEA3152442.1 alanine racemase [Betaproteobacteria bacterium]
MRPITATINLEALRHNYEVARRHARGAKAMAVIKANAYGHGLMRAARALAEADGYALVELDAAVRLREAGYRQRIVLLEGFFDVRELAVIMEHKLATVIHSSEQLDMMKDVPAGAQLDVMLKLNTGMNRLGFQASEFQAALARVKAHPAVGSITLITHFANADDDKGVAWQLRMLERVAGADSLPRSLANSAAILRHPETHADWVRPGIMLYGCSPFPDSTGEDVGLKPVMTLASELISIRELVAGDAVGYGGGFVAEHPIRIGVVACGYADGYPRHAPTGSPVLVGGTLTHTLGRVSMDMLSVDLSAISDARVGTRVVVWGEGNPVEHVAHAAGTVGYELLCAVAPRVRIIEEP